MEKLKVGINFIVYLKCGYIICYFIPSGNAFQRDAPQYEKALKIKLNFLRLL